MEGGSPCPPVVRLAATPRSLGSRRHGNQRPYKWAVALAALFLYAAPARADVSWAGYAAASRQAAAQKKPLFIDFRADWCGPCKMLEAQTFPDAGVQRLLGQCVAARVDVDADTGTAKQFGVSSIPRLVVILGGKRVLDVTGFRPAAVLRQELASALGGKPVVQDASGPAPAPEAPEIAELRAHEKSGTYAAWRAREPRKAAKAVAQQIARLASFDGAERQDAEELLSRAGTDGIAALVGGLAHSQLAVRVACHQLLVRLVADVHRVPAAAQPAFDPWAPTAQRQAAARTWAVWWSARANAARP